MLFLCIGIARRLLRYFSAYIKCKWLRKDVGWVDWVVEIVKKYSIFCLETSILIHDIWISNPVGL